MTLSQKRTLINGYRNNDCRAACHEHIKVTYRIITTGYASDQLHKYSIDYTLITGRRNIVESKN